MKIVDLRNSLRLIAVNQLMKENKVVGVLACDTSTMLDLFIKKRKANLIPLRTRRGIERAYIDNGGNYNTQDNVLLMVSLYVDLRLKYNNLLAEDMVTEHKTNATAVRKGEQL